MDKCDRYNRFQIINNKDRGQCFINIQRKSQGNSYTETISFKTELLIFREKL